MAGLLSKRLLFVTGKGGVGKSTITAALGLRAARLGRKVLICEVRAHERIPQLLGKPPVGPDIREIEPDLFACNIDINSAFRDYALMKLKLKTLYRAVFENRLMRYALKAIPSIAEIVVLGKVVYHLGEQGPYGGNRFDVVIVDAPATGHALTLLRTPQVILEAVPTGPMADEMRHIRDVMADRAMSGVVMVSLPEEMPVNETIELDQQLAKFIDIERSAVVLNGDLPLRFNSLDLNAAARDPRLRACAEAAAAYQHRSDLAAAYVAKLKEQIPLPLARVPYRFSERFGRATIEEISHDLAVLS
jgi:anion-transporting  ArsA/GET3 family ATPase